MATLAWDKSGHKFFESGVDRGVFFPNGSPGVPWNGIVSIEETSSGGETEATYVDGFKFYDNVANTDFQATLEAFTYPDEFAVCEGVIEIAPGLVFANQTRQTFGLAWRTKIGNDLDGIEHGYRLHLVYNATAAPSSRAYSTISDSPSPVTFSWTIDAVPNMPGQDLSNQDLPGNWAWPEGYGMTGWPTGPDGNTPVRGWRATAYIMVESKDVSPAVLTNLENMLYGTSLTPPYLPSQFDVANLLAGKVVPFNPPFEYTEPPDSVPQGAYSNRTMIDVPDLTHWAKALFRMPGKKIWLMQGQHHETNIPTLQMLRLNADKTISVGTEYTGGGNYTDHYDAIGVVLQLGNRILLNNPRDQIQKNMKILEYNETTLEITESDSVNYPSEFGISDYIEPLGNRSAMFNGLDKQANVFRVVASVLSPTYVVIGHELWTVSVAGGQFSSWTSTDIGWPSTTDGTAWIYSQYPEIDLGWGQYVTALNTWVSQPNEATFIDLSSSSNPQIGTKISFPEKQDPFPITTDTSPSGWYSQVLPAIPDTVNGLFYQATMNGPISLGRFHATATGVTMTATASSVKDPSFDLSENGTSQGAVLVVIQWSPTSPVIAWVEYGYNGPYLGRHFTYDAFGDTPKYVKGYGNGEPEDYSVFAGPSGAIFSVVAGSNAMYEYHVPRIGLYAPANWVVPNDVAEPAPVIPHPPDYVPPPPPPPPPPPTSGGPGDLFDDAQPITFGQTTTPVDTTNYTRESDEPVSGQSRSIWWTFRVLETKMVRVSVIQPNPLDPYAFDPVLEVWGNTQFNDLILMHYSDDSDGSYLSEPMEKSLEPGLYYIRVTTYNGSVGTVSIKLEDLS